MRLRALSALGLAVALAAVPLSASAAPVVTPQLAILPPASIPSSIAVDSAGNIYTSNLGLQTISKITPAGGVTPAFAALPGSGIRKIVVDSIGDIFSANYTSGTMTQILPDGSVDATYPLGTGSAPTALAIAPDETIYTANSGLNSVSSLNPARNVLAVNFATLAAGANPRDITVDDAGNIYTLNSNLTVSKITPAGVVTPAFATLIAGTDAGNIVVNSAGFVYVSDYAGQRIEQFDSTGPTTAAPRWGPPSDVSLWTTTTTSSSLFRSRRRSRWLWPSVERSFRRSPLSVPARITTRSRSRPMTSLWRPDTRTPPCHASSSVRPSRRRCRPGPGPWARPTASR